MNMGQFNDTDIAITQEGDLIIEDGDFKLISKDDVIIQNVHCRLKSSDPEWLNEIICANLEDLFGLPNTRETGQKGEDLIKTALTADGLLLESEIYVKAVPVDRERIVYYIYFQSPYAIKPIGFEVQLNLNAGPSIRRIQ